MVGSPWESSNVLVPAARPKMPRRAYEFRQGRLRRAYEFSPSASGELRNSTRTCLDAGSVFSLHVRAHTRAHTQLSTVWQSPHAACSSMQQRAHDLCPCVHAPESCCQQPARKLRQAASDFGQPLPRLGYALRCARAHRDCDWPQQVPWRAYACHMHLPRREDEFSRGTEQCVGACCPPKMPLRYYEFRQARQRRAYEFSPSASGEILKPIRTCLDAGPALHVGTTCATRTAQHGVASAAQHVRGCKRGPTICAHACMRRSLVADSPPEKLMQ